MLQSLRGFFVFLLNQSSCCFPVKNCINEIVLFSGHPGLVKISTIRGKVVFFRFVAMNVST